jgi:hypothetical protein
VEVRVADFAFVWDAIGIQPSRQPLLHVRLWPKKAVRHLQQQSSVSPSLC